MIEGREYGTGEDGREQSNGCACKSTAQRPREKKGQDV